MSNRDEPMLYVGQVAAVVDRAPSTVRRACERGLLDGAVLVVERGAPVWRIPARYADETAYRAAVGAPRGRVGRRRENSDADD